MDIKKELAELGVNVVGMVAGVAGSFVTSVLDEKLFSFRNALFNVIIAVPLSAYGTTAIAYYFNWLDKPQFLGVIGLGLGLCGRYIGRGILNLGKKFEKNPVKFIKTKGGADDTDS